MKAFWIITTLVVTSSPATAFAQNSLASAEKTIPGGTLALASYVALWFLLLGYVLLMTIRLAGLSREINTLEKRIDDMFGDD